MILFYLTEMTLEVSLAVAWWTCKKTFQVTSYSLKYLYDYYYSENEETRPDTILTIKNCACIKNCDCL